MKHRCRDNPHHVPCDVCKKPVCEDCNRFCTSSDHVVCSKCVLTTCPRCGPENTYCEACTELGKCDKCGTDLCHNEFDAYKPLCRQCRPKIGVLAMTKEEARESDFAAYNRFKKHAKKSFGFFKKYDRTVRCFADILRDKFINVHSTILRNDIFDKFEELEDYFDDTCAALEDTEFANRSTSCS